MALVKDLLTIEVIDKRTGEVVSKETSERSMTESGARMLLYFIRGLFEDADAAKDWKYVYLFDANKSKIKILEGSWGAVETTASYCYCVLTAMDDSTDSYTTNYQGLYFRTDATILPMMCIWQQQSKTKASDQVLRVTWEVRVPYTPTP